MQSIAETVVVVRISAVDYGTRFKQLRKARWRGTVLALAKALGSDYAATVYNIERDWRVPTLPTLARHARALGCDPWELLDHVEAEVDRVRAIGRLPKSDALKAWSLLLERYEASTQRGSGKHPLAVAATARRLARDAKPGIKRLAKNAR